MYKGLENWTLRYLASGKPAYFILAKTYQMSVFQYNLSAALRDHDLDALAAAWNKSQPTVLPTGTDDQKTALLKVYAKAMGQQLTQHVSGDEQLYNRVKELEKELATAKSMPESRPSSSNQHGGHKLEKYGHSNQTKVLEKDGPKTNRPKEITAYMNRVLSKDQLKKIPSHIPKIKALLADYAEERQLEILRVSLVEWGMPISVASTLDIEASSKTLAATYLLTLDA